MNSLFQNILAQVNPEIPTPERLTGASGLIMRDLILIVGLGLVLGLLMVVWARAYARRRKRKRHHSTPAILQHSSEGKGDVEDSRHRRRRRRRRRRQQDHPQHNPTLSETGGLPPVRPDPPAAPTP